MPMKVGRRPRLGARHPSVALSLVQPDPRPPPVLARPRRILGPSGSRRTLSRNWWHLKQKRQGGLISRWGLFGQVEAETHFETSAEG